MNLTLHPIDVMLLRSAIGEVRRLWPPEPTGRVTLPRLPGGPRDEEEAVEVGDALTAALGAVASATRRLRSGGVGLDLGGEPLALRLSGELVGTSPDAGQIFIRVRPEGKETIDARQSLQASQG